MGRQSRKQQRQDRKFRILRQREKQERKAGRKLFGVWKKPYDIYAAAKYDLSEQCCICEDFIFQYQAYVRGTMTIAHFRCATANEWYRRPTRKRPVYKAAENALQKIRVVKSPENLERLADRYGF